jgi:hypothetical protein
MTTQGWPFVSHLGSSIAPWTPEYNAVGGIPSSKAAASTYALKDDPGWCGVVTVFTLSFW